jgi:hypothetical protein
LASIPLDRTSKALICPTLLNISSRTVTPWESLM